MTDASHWLKVPRLAVLYSVLTLLPFSADDTSASPTNIWDVTFGGTNADRVACLVPDTTNGFLITGSSWSDASGNKTEASWGVPDYWIVKTTSQGQKLWEKGFGGTGGERLYDTIAVSNGFLLSGSSDSVPGGNKTAPLRGGDDYWIVRISPTGSIIWDKTFGGTDTEWTPSVIRMAEDQFLVAGSSFSGMSGNKTEPTRGSVDFWAVMINGAGDKVWDRRFGGSGIDIVRRAIRTSDGSILMVGDSTSGNDGDVSETTRGGADFWVVKIDANGQKLWDHRFGGSGDEVPQSVIETSDGGFLVVGDTWSPASGDISKPSYGTHDGWCIKTDSAGKLLWDARMGGSANDKFTQVVEAPTSPYYILAGYSGSPASGSKSAPPKGQFDVWVVAMSLAGHRLWDLSLGGDGDDDTVGTPFMPSSNTLVIAAGSTSSASGDKTMANIGSWDYWLVSVTNLPTESVMSYVDDDGPNDPGPGDPNVSDPFENGTVDHPFDSIQEAIDVAFDDDTILVRDGVYTSSGNRDIRLNGKAITIRSERGYKHTLIENNFFSGFICDSGESTDSVIQGFSIHTWASFQGLEGIVCNGASPSIRDCMVWDCGRAGILCTNGAAPLIENCIVVGNEGGIKAYSSSPKIDRCNISSNATARGAGIYIEGTSSPLIRNCLIADNHASDEGGGVYLAIGATMTNINCTIAGNSASNRGGGVANRGAPVIRNAVIYNNAAPSHAGIYASTAMNVEHSCLQSFYPGLGNKTGDPGISATSGYQLRLGSTAIDAGSMAFMPTVDLLGAPRPLDGDADGTNIVDMGAYEFISSISDTDHDGLPDAWEWSYGLNPVGTNGSNDVIGDPDSDGLNNWQEWMAGTDPTNNLSVFQFNVPGAISSDGFIVRWPSISNRYYNLYRATNLMGGGNAFTVVPGASNLPATPTENSYTDTVNGVGPAYYRIGVYQ